MENNKINNRRTKSLIIYGVLLLSAVSAFWMLSKPVLTNHECYVSITAREMLQSGDWIMPTCNGKVRLQKTPLSYWLVAGLARITGSVDEFTARLPSAAFAFLSVAAILYFVNGWLGLRAAALSAAVWATSLCYVRYAHNAQPEMALTFFVELCFLSFYSAITAGSRKRQVVYMLIFWTSFGLANLAKGPAPLPYVLVPLFFYIAVFRQWEKVPKLLPVIGTIIFLVISLPWPLAVAHRANWDLVLWKHEFIDRLFGKYDSGNKEIYYYLYIMLQFIMPWAAFLPMALAAPFYRIWNKKQPAMQFLWFWFVADLVFITISGGKRQHYILSLMPAMAILVGILIEDMVFVQKAYTPKLAKAVLRAYIMVIIVGAVAGPIYVARAYPQILTETIIIGVITVIAAAAVGVLFARRRPAAGCAIIFAGILIVVMISCDIFYGPLNRDVDSRDFSKRVAEIVPPPGKLEAYGYVSMRSVYYFGRIIPSIKDKSVLHKHYEDGGWVLASMNYMEELARDGRFRMVYHKDKAELRGPVYTAGALFHKSAPVIDGGGNSNLK